MAKRSFSRLVKILTGVHTDAETEFSRLERFAHFWVLVGRSFVRNRCPVRAAALSYTTLLALIPLLAVAISVTSSLLKNQGEEKIYGAIDRLVSNFIPPATAELNTNSAAHISQRKFVAALLQESMGPTLLGGDFNVSNHNSLVEQFGRVGYQALQTSEVTWRRRPYVLDHIFFSRHLRPVGHEVKQTEASDHNALLGEFEFA